MFENERSREDGHLEDEAGLPDCRPLAEIEKELRERADRLQDVMTDPTVDVENRMYFVDGIMSTLETGYIPRATGEEVLGRVYDTLFGDTLN